MSIEALRDTVRRLSLSANALAALAAALDARISGVPLGHDLTSRVDEVVAALGLGDALEHTTPLELRTLLGEIRTYALTSRRLLFPSSDALGWSHHEPELLVAAGQVSAGFPAAFRRAVAPELGDLVERLSRPGAAFLNIGVGTAIMAIEMARSWPSLRIVGIDPWAPALALARDHVRVAGLEQRIELREQRAEELCDGDAFDLAWIPSAFIAETAMPAILERTHGALRRGGWLLLPIIHPHGDELAASVARLRVTLFGGLATKPAAAEDLLRSHAFEEVRTLPAPQGSLAAMIVGRRAPALNV